MNKKSRISHHLIIDYLGTSPDDETITKVSQMRETNPDYSMFFDIVDTIKDKADLSENKIVSTGSNFNFVDIEAMLSHFIGGNFERHEMNYFLQSLINSANFYNRVLIKCASISIPQDVKNNVITSEILIKSDQEIFDHISKIRGTKLEPTFLPSVREKIHRSIDNIKKAFDTFSSIFRPIPGYAYGIALVILISLATYKIYDMGNTPMKYLSFKDQVPYEYESELRSISDSITNVLELQLFHNNFKIAMSDYMIHDYESANETLVEIEPIAIKYSVESNKTEIMKLLRDYYFYWGLCNIALATGREVDDEASRSYLKKSTHYLLKASSITRIHLQENVDRENYFLGIAHTLSNQQKLALQYFQQIDKESHFYDKKDAIINSW